VRILEGMPTYEYRCGGCTREFEYQQRMSDPDLVTCEACGADKLERLISWTSVRSNTWKQALETGGMPKEVMKGTHAVDGSKSHRFKGNEAEAAPGSRAKPGTPDIGTELAAQGTCAEPCDPCVCAAAPDDPE
jgi:putative FmdB family regulatory protein